MKIIFHPHALDRMYERGANKSEVKITIEEGEQFPAKFNRTGFRKNFPFNKMWRGKFYHTKQVEVYAIKEAKNWVVITIITKYF